MTIGANGGITRMRQVLVALLAVVVAGLAVVDAAVRAPSVHSLSSLSAMASGHPVVLTRSLELLASGAARNSGNLENERAGSIRLLLRRDPLGSLAPLMLGAGQQVDGNVARATSLYRLAVAREPRDPAARLLLADSLLRSGDVAGALDQMVALAKVSPMSAEQVTKAIAEYSRTPGAARRIRPLIDRDPVMGDRLLAALATDPDNLTLVESLASNKRLAASGDGWPQGMLNALVGAGKYNEAYGFWSRLTGQPRSAGGLFNSDFENLALAKPFDWSLSPGPAGLAEFEPGGGLNVVYYGREDGVFAGQLAILPPGTYRLVTRASGNGPSDGLGWRIRCASGAAIATIPLQPEAGRPATFTVSPDCSAQWIELIGTAPDNERLVESVIRLVTLEKVAG